MIPVMLYTKPAVCPCFAANGAVNAFQITFAYSTGCNYCACDYCAAWGGQVGMTIKNKITSPGIFDMPIKAETEVELRNKMRSILRMINPLKDDGILRCIAADGSVRELTCRYSGGLEGDESRENRGIWWQKAILVFNADDPFWYDSSTIVQTFKLNENPGTFFPILPLRLVSSTVFADINIDNTGDVETYPEWIIQGPGETIKITNMTTGDVIYLDHTDAILQAGETVTINTSPYGPNKKTITKSDGTNVFYWLSDDSS
jgi:hypothetical protein